MLIRNLKDNGDLIDRDIRDLVIFVSQVQNAGLNIHHVAAKCRVGAACDVDFLTH